MYAQYDADWNEYFLMDSLVDHYNENKAISLTDQQTSIQGRPETFKSTAGWKNCSQWKDGSTSWEKLSNLMKFHPVQMAKFAIAYGHRS